jgi:hypothetical protein
LKGASGESKGSRLYDKENLLWYLLWQSGLTLLAPFDAYLQWKESGDE